MNSLEKKEELSHNYALDVLRIIMCLFVVIIHVCSYGITDETLTITNIFDISSEYNWYNFLESLCRPAVIVFVMISGSYMLDPNKNVDKAFLKKHIIKLFKALCLFSLAWALFFSLFHWYFDNESISLMNIIKDFIDGKQLWYLYMIICLYILTPILRKISSDDSTLNAFIIIGIVVTIVIPSIKLFINSEIINALISNFHFELVTGYSVYYMIGYKLRKFINENTFNKKTIILMIVLYIISTFICMVLTAKWRVDNNDASSFPYYSYFFITAFIQSVSIFYIFLCLDKQKMFKNKKIISKCTSYCSGIYYMHYGILSGLLCFFDFNFYAPIRIFILFIITTVLSIVCTFVLKKMPIIKKLL